LTYTLTVTNNNSSYPNNAPGVVLTDTLGSNLSFVSATTSQGTISQSGGVITVSLGTVAFGGTATVTVTAQATEDGNLSNSALVSYGNDPVSGNNTASATTVVAEPAINVSGPIVVTARTVTNLTVATFTHASGVEPTSAFTATINWGDSRTSRGTITLSGTTYTVKGSHSYRRFGTYTVTTTVVENGSKPNTPIFGAPTSDSGGTVSSSALPPITIGGNPFQAPSLVPTSRNAAGTGFTIAGSGLSTSGPAVSPGRLAIDPGVAILDMYSSLPSDQGVGSLEMRLKLDAKAKPRFNWQS
jgi:uncharacterized repeat protein (TIGR01451 family)